MNKFIIVLLVTSFLVGCSQTNEEQRQNNYGNELKEEEKDLSQLVAFLEEQGFNLGDRTKMLSEILGAEEAYNFMLDSNQVELYRFNYESMNDLDREAIEEARATGIFDPTGFNVPLIFNEQFALFISEYYPDRDKLINAFTNF
jgi:hypothetical protein